MRAYYDQRATEYDDWWLGRGLFARAQRPGWEAEVRRLVDLVRDLTPARVLDVACGTGFLTRHLRGEVVALDQSPRMVERTAANAPSVRVIQGDAVPLPFADATFDRVFTSHFYGHLLPDEREAFLAEARRVAAQLVVVDSAYADGTDRVQWQDRVLSDGSAHRVYKRFFTGAELAAELGDGELLHAGRWFVVAAG